MEFAPAPAVATNDKQAENQRAHSKVEAYKDWFLFYYGGADKYIGVAEGPALP
jgi:hypothetical protein